MIRTIFMGTPDFALPILEALVKLPSIELVAVYTEPDKPRGRGLKISVSPVKGWAVSHQIPVEQPPGFRKDPAHLVQLKGYRPELIVVAAYGKMLPKELIAIPRYGAINVHPSLLPKYRGASPIQSALLNNDPRTGVTLMVIDQGMDTGPIVSHGPCAIDPEDTYASLAEKLSRLGGELMQRDLPRYLAGELTPRPQRTTGVSVTRLIEKTDGEIDWTQSAKVIVGKIRALTPWPGAYTFLTDGTRLIITQAHLEGGRLRIDRVKVAGRAESPWAAFVLGYQGRLPAPMGERLGLKD